MFRNGDCPRAEPWGRRSPQRRWCVRCDADGRLSDKTEFCSRRRGGDVLYCILDDPFTPLPPRALLALAVRYEALRVQDDRCMIPLRYVHSCIRAPSRDSADGGTSLRTMLGWLLYASSAGSAVEGGCAVSGQAGHLHKSPGLLFLDLGRSWASASLLVAVGGATTDRRYRT